VRRLLIAGSLIAAVAPASAALASAPPDTEPMPSAASEMETAGTPASEAATSTAPEPATVYDDDGNEVASITVSTIEPSWGDYGDDDAPDEGMEYVRATVQIDSMQTDGTFDVAIDDFVLQDNHGSLTTAANVPTAEQADSGEDVTTDAELASGESVELALTFQVTANVGPQSIFYHPSDDVLVDVADV
jgi:hypothetical protein